jgi:hypothetical protein
VNKNRKVYEMIKASNTTICIKIFVIIFLLSGLVFSQEGEEEIYTSIGLDVGYFIPLGEWADHPFAEGVKQFKGSFKIGAELEFRLFSLPMGLFYHYSKLDVSEWEDFANSQGSPIAASAYSSDFGIVFKIYVLKQKPSFLNLEIGGGYSSIQGRETFTEFSYDYTFLKPNACMIIGLNYRYMVAEKVLLTMGTRFFYLPEGVEYANRKTLDVTSLPVSLGVRFLF